VGKVVETGGVDASGGLSDALDSAEEMLAESAAGDAAQVFSAIIRGRQSEYKSVQWTSKSQINFG
jgi:hypothetical protein